MREETTSWLLGAALCLALLAIHSASASTAYSRQGQSGQRVHFGQRTTRLHPHVVRFRSSRAHLSRCLTSEAMHLTARNDDFKSPCGTAEIPSRCRVRRTASYFQAAGDHSSHDS